MLVIDQRTAQNLDLTGGTLLLNAVLRVPRGRGCRIVLIDCEVVSLCLGARLKCPPIFLLPMMLVKCRKHDREIWFERYQGSTESTESLLCDRKSRGPG